jgi:putative phage-type endonuclease
MLHFFLPLCGLLMPKLPHTGFAEGKRKIFLMEMEQRSSEWHAFRAGRIGGSDAPIVCGLSPWKSPRQLWEEKTGRRPQPDNANHFAIQRGIRLEPMVLGMLQIDLDLDMAPATLVHPEKNYMMASLDGWNAETLTLAEIKVGNMKDHQRCDPRDPKSIPEKYYPQLQHQIYVTNAERAYYASYGLPKGAPDQYGQLKIITIPRDEEFLRRYLPIAEEFFRSLSSGSPPETSRIDYELR